MAYPTTIPVRLFKEGEYAVINGKKYVPERTCHMELRKRGAIYDVFYFDCCDEEYSENRTDQYASGVSGKVCPYCGAKVVEE